MKLPNQATDEIKRAVWSGGKKATLQDHFLIVTGGRIEWFGEYDDLCFLQILANALRHGDGPSAEQLHRMCPTLWINWCEPGTQIPTGGYLSANGPRHPSFDDISLPRALLEQMIMAVFAFWEDIEFVRCNSFSNRQPNTEKYLAELRSCKARRPETRVWKPSIS
ncbi:hypothetical protein H8Z73_22270 (plasmid) [Xanthomonas citri pv. citri]|uniref:hypothetical protein n=1 Tax=Xanthomonas citri TaxID=346 RepID=UPI001933840F|nr:hypothetical protein [Xanthomonas citri]QRD67156.1 hypothetical protein H8Z73_22270 [Xanthomonas citri pv. citri]